MMAAVTQQLPWLASRALGVVAMLLLGTTVGLGLFMAGRLSSRPGAMARLRRFHEAAAIVTVGFIGAHGGVLLFDRFLHPGLVGVTVPFTMHYRPLFTGLGVVAGWGAAALGLSFYARRRIGVRRWRRLHRLMIVVYLLSLTHVVGAGTNGLSRWMLMTLSVLTAPVVFAFSLRLLGGGSAPASSVRRPARAPAAAPWPARRPVRSGTP